MITDQCESNGVRREETDERVEGNPAGASAQMAFKFRVRDRISGIVVVATAQTLRPQHKRNISHPRRGFVHRRDMIGSTRHTIVHRLQGVAPASKSHERKPKLPSAGPPRVQR